MIVALIALGLVFVVFAGLVAWLAAPFIAQILDDATRRHRSGFLQHHADYQPPLSSRWKEHA